MRQMASNIEGECGSKVAVVLIGSNPHDDDARVTRELLRRVRYDTGGTINRETFRVGTVNISFDGKDFTIKALLAEDEHHDVVCDTFLRLTKASEEGHIVTKGYRALPRGRTNQIPEPLLRALREDRIANEENTAVELLGIDKKYDLFAIVPDNPENVSMMEVNTLSVVELMVDGVWTVDGKELKSPIRKVTQVPGSARWKIMSTYSENVHFVRFMHAMITDYLPQMLSDGTPFNIGIDMPVDPQVIHLGFSLYQVLIYLYSLATPR